MLIGALGTNFSETVIELQTFSLKKIRLNLSSAKCLPFRLILNVLTVALLGQVVTCHVIGTKPLPTPMLTLVALDCVAFRLGN